MKLSTILPKSTTIVSENSVDEFSSYYIKRSDDSNLDELNKEDTWCRNQASTVKKMIHQLYKKLEQRQKSKELADLVNDPKYKNTVADVPVPTNFIRPYVCYYTVPDLTHPFSITTMRMINRITQYGKILTHLVNRQSKILKLYNNFDDEWFNQT